MNLITKTYVINLDKRKDRLKHIVQEFEKINFTNYERFPAIETSFGGLGCCQSHLRLMEKISVIPGIFMIVEDDAEFMMPKTVIDKYIMEFISDESADAMCLDYNTRMFCDYNESFKRALHTCSTCCYLVKTNSPNNVVQQLIDCFKKSEKGLLNTTHNLDPTYHQYAIDQTWKEVQQNSIFLLPVERCVIQYTNYSDISKQVEVRYI
jgi:hypothetical protein